ncbi:MAG TPA: hypothetical protein VJ824_05310 [Bacillota bacterium]|nr:hypothetical protein [Bacillota bacterium]
MITAREQSNLKSNGEKLKKQTWIPNKTERNRILLAIGAAILLLLFGYWTIHSFPLSFHTRSFKGFFKNYGSYAQFAFFFVLIHYGLMIVLKRNLHQNIGKQMIIKLSRVTRQWHTPAAILAIALVIIHIVGAFLYGFKWDFGNISGILALLALLPVPISGLLRYRKLDRKWHWGSAISFTILFMLHSFS